MTTSADPTPEQRLLLQRAHERLRAASKALQSLVATDPIKGRWKPEVAPAQVLEAAREDLRQAQAQLTVCETRVLGWHEDTEAITVLDGRRLIAFSFQDLLDYHGPGSPGGVAHAFKLMQRAFGLLDPDAPLQRREVTLATAFGGPGARDGFELVTRAVTGDRYVLDPALERPERGVTLERFVFRVGYRGRSVTLVVREGIVPDEFIALARKERTDDDETRFALLKLEMTERVTSKAPADVYDVAEAVDGG